MIIGLAASLPMVRALSVDPFYLQLDDPVALAGVLALAALAAATWPAARALRGNPIDALRQS
jgi:ABC-type lipoprotein release transport system permease subunit